MQRKAYFSMSVCLSVLCKALALHIFNAKYVTVFLTFVCDFHTIQDYFSKL